MSEDIGISKYKYQALKNKWCIGDYGYSGIVLDALTTDALIEMRNLAIHANMPLDEVNRTANKAIGNWIDGGDKFGYFTNPDTAKHLHKVYLAFGDSIDSGLYHTLAKACVERVLESGLSESLFRCLHALDTLTLPQEELKDFNLRMVQEALRDEEVLHDYDSRYFFEDRFSIPRNKDDMRAKLIADRKVQKEFRSWVENRFDYYDMQGENEHSAIIGSLGGLELELWKGNARKRLVQIFRSNVDGRNSWIENSLEYARALIECVNYPRAELVDLTREIKGYDQIKAREFTDWLKGGKK